MTRADKVIRFIHEYCVIPEGALVGQPVRLVAFQEKFIRDVYDNPAGTRRALLSIARKNGKTALIACILLAHIVGPEAKLNSQIISGAMSRDQAALVFNLASKMVQLSPRLAALVKIVPSGKRLIGTPLNVEYRALSAEAKTAHGLSPVLAIIDEPGQIRGPQDDFVDAITTSQGAHAAPLLIAISTQAATDADLFSQWLDDAQRSSDPRIVCHLHAAPQDADIMDKAGWAAANPALGLFRSLDDLEENAKQASRMPSMENTFRNLLLNQRVSVDSPFISRSVWKACEGKVLPFDRSTVVYGGLDLSQRLDLTALVLVGKIEGKWHVVPYFWAPAEGVVERSKRDRVPYDLWAKQGFIRLTPGHSVDYFEVAREMADICAGLNIKTIAYDKYCYKYLDRDFEDAGVFLPFTEMRQGFVTISPAMDALEAELVNSRVVHDGNPVLTMCAANGVVTKDTSGNRKINKQKATGRIDGLVALTMAIGATVADVEEDLGPPMVY